MRRALAKVNFTGELMAVSDGEEVIEYLEGKGGYADRDLHPLPCLILLDIKMLHLGGLEVLKWIRSRTCFDEIPVIMLTSSSQESDVAAAYALKADAYLVKPADLDVFRALVKDITALCGAGRTSDAPIVIRGAVPAP
jgi:CheY-like chemotaxis protein